MTDYLAHKAEVASNMQEVMGYLVMHSEFNETLKRTTGIAGYNNL